MGTIADKLQTLRATKQQIKAAIQDRGVTIGETDPFSTYPDKIGEITTGGSVSFPPGIKFANSFWTEIPQSVIDYCFTVDDIGAFFQYNRFITSELRLATHNRSANLNNLFHQCEKLAEVAINVEVCTYLGTCFGNRYNPMPNLTSITIYNMGNMRNIGYDLTGLNNWDHDTLYASLYTHSKNPNESGYPSCTVTLQATVLDRLSEEEKAAITAKGFTLTSF